MKDLLTLPTLENSGLIRRKSGGLRATLSANLRNRIKHVEKYEMNLMPLFLGLLNPYTKVILSFCSKWLVFVTRNLVC